jgi:hypothetical protein
VRDTTDSGRERSRAGIRRVAWFAALYLAGLAVTAALTYGLRALLPG